MAVTASGRASEEHMPEGMWRCRPHQACMVAAAAVEAVVRAAGRAQAGAAVGAGQAGGTSRDLVGEGLAKTAAATAACRVTAPPPVTAAAAAEVAAEVAAGRSLAEWATSTASRISTCMSSWTLEEVYGRCRSRTGSASASSSWQVWRCGRARCWRMARWSLGARRQRRRRRRRLLRGHGRRPLPRWRRRQVLQCLRLWARRRRTTSRPSSQRLTAPASLQRARARRRRRSRATAVSTMRRSSAAAPTAA
mmetsp:Transcript_39797/g.118490  ORF Transcript_39797/g.118490 Transcript_39797/m.118490 type:complete len:250 (-) Transcript_39797:849-1598(-)